MLGADPRFDLSLAEECARAFSETCGVGCVISNTMGDVWYECGYGCQACEICRAAGCQPEECTDAHVYGMTEAARFGGKYIYFCPMGLTCFVTPIQSRYDVRAKMTVGPFLMVDRVDYINSDLKEKHLSPEAEQKILKALERVPSIPAERVNSMSTILFMAVSFINNITNTEQTLAAHGGEEVRGQITAYIEQLKTDGRAIPYPYEKEQALMRAVRHGNRSEAERLLNELLAFVLLSSGGRLYPAKVRICELMILFSRAAMDSGASPDDGLTANNRYLLEMNEIHDFDALCLWLTNVMNTLMDSVFDFSGTRHASVIHQSVQYINTHYDQRLTLDDMARRVYLSPPYFSRIFKEEVGETFTSYLSRVRVDRSRDLLRHKNLRLADIALLVGFEDQSYFTKVFKKITGIPPLRYRESIQPLE